MHLSNTLEHSLGDFSLGSSATYSLIVVILTTARWESSTTRNKPPHLDHYILPPKNKVTAPVLNRRKVLRWEFFWKPAAGTKDTRDILDRLHQHPRGAYSQQGLSNIQILRSCPLKGGLRRWLLPRPSLNSVRWRRAALLNLFSYGTANVLLLNLALTVSTILPLTTCKAVNFLHTLPPRTGGAASLSRHQDTGIRTPLVHRKTPHFPLMMVP